MIRELEEREILKFIDFGDRLNADDPNYVPYIRKELEKSLEKLVFEKKKYKAVCSFDERGNINGRILLTVGHNKKLDTDYCGYFSHVEFVKDYSVFKELMDFAIFCLKDMGAQYMLGSFFPFDPDNRRGILIEGFELFPMIFTSHNPAYYGEYFERYGFEKLVDAYEYEYKFDKEILDKVKQIADKSKEENSYYLSKIDIKHPDRDIEDVHRIMEIASTQINFENVLSKEEIKKIFVSWKSFINPDYAFIARRKEDDSPIGFTLSIPNYYELIKKMKGRRDLRGILIFALGKKKITGLRGILQYIIPEYQHKGVSKALYWANWESVNKNGIKRVSLGTIMENNGKSNGAISSLGAELSRIYRIYYKKL